MVHSTERRVAGPLVGIPSGPGIDSAKPSPIRTLHPKVRPWSVVLRVTAKYVMRAVKNAASTTGTLKIFSFDGMDAAGDEVRVVSFNTAAEKFCDVVEVGKI